MAHIRFATVAGLMVLMSATAGCAEPCFIPGTEPPAVERVLPEVNNGQAGRELMEAVFRGDRDAVDRMLRADPKLVTTGDGRFADLLNVAVGRCDKAMTELLLARGAPPDGPRGEVPLALALRARDPWFAERLLQAGAKPDGGPDANGSPVIEAMTSTSPDALALLLRHGLELNTTDEFGQSLLLNAVDGDNFTLAEWMLDRGADPWRVSIDGGNVATGAAEPLVLDWPEEEKARQRFAAKLQALGWPWPPPPIGKVRALVMAGQWPPEAARKAGVKPPADWIVAEMRREYLPDGARRPKSTRPD